MKRNQTALSAIALLLGAGAVHAGSVTFDTDTYAGGTSILPPTTTNWDTTTPPPNPMLLPQFNDSLPGVPAGATLTGITINWDGVGEFEYRIENIDPNTSSTGTNELIVNLDIFAPAGYTDALSVSSGLLNIDLTAFDGSIDFGGTSGTDFGVLTGSDSGSFGIAAGDFGAYSGAGDFDLNGTAGSDSDRNISGGDLLEQTTWRGGMSASITYAFDEEPPVTVPLPAPLALLGLGLAGLAAVRRRAK